jgi:acetylornithine/succinyldiaminopimelate/putrescine aminotransferase
LPSAKLAILLSGKVHRMSTTQVRPAIFLLTAALLGLMAISAPTAHADAVDGNFLNALKAKGVTFASSQAAVQAGHQVCDNLDQGRATQDVANDVMQQSGLDGYHAGFFVGVSVAAFCPRHAGQ